MTPPPRSATPRPAPEASARSYMPSRLFARLFLVALPGLIAVIVVGLVALFAFGQLGSQTSGLNKTLQADAVVNHLIIHIDDLVTSLDQLTLPNAQYNPTIFDKTQAKITQDLADLDRVDLNFSGNEQSKIVALKTSTRALVRDMEKLNSADLTNPTQRNALWVNQLRARTLQLQTLMENQTHHWDTQIGDHINNANTAFEWGQSGILGITLLTILASVLLAVLLTRRTMRPIQRLKEHMARVAVGDLSAPQRVPAFADGNELAALESDYQHTLDMLRPLISRIQEDAAHISSSAAEISAAAAQQASGSGEQAAAITEVTVTVEELNQTAVQIAEAAASVASAAEQALVSANRGQEAVRDSILGMAMIKSRVNDITARILALSDQSQRISEVIDLISTIAAQTHILALNAAVESAGAGEYGERFAVVAAEVKKLAQRSVTATKEVRAIIAQIQAATAAAVMATEEGLKETDRGVALAHQSGDANDDIISMVERTAQLANAISLATQQQRTASEQVVATMREVAEVTRQAAVSSQQASGAANELSAIASELRSVSQGFKIVPAPSTTNGHGPDPAPDLPGGTLAFSLPGGGDRP